MTQDRISKIIAQEKILNIIWFVADDPHNRVVSNPVYVTESEDFARDLTQGLNRLVRFPYRAVWFQINPDFNRGDILLAADTCIARAQQDGVPRNAFIKPKDERAFRLAVFGAAKCEEAQEDRP